MVTIVLLKVESTCAMPVWTFLLPFALMILGFSTSSGLRERFSLGASTGGASSFFALTDFFAGLAAGSAAALTGAGAATGASSGFAVGDSDADKTSAADVSATSSAALTLEAFGLSALSGLAGFFFSSEFAMSE